jgi:hypothetical protein
MTAVIQAEMHPARSKPWRLIASTPALFAPADELEKDIPQASWDQDQLDVRAVYENSCIGDDEGRVTPHYWFLGTALNLLRRGYAKGAWEGWLAERGIDETRALRARQLASAFESPEELSGLSLRQALKLVAKRRDKNPRGLDPKFARRLRAMVKSLQTTVAELKRIDPSILEQRARLLGPAQEVSRLAAALCQVCTERSAHSAGPVDGNTEPSDRKPAASGNRSHTRRKPR